jgi:4-hydroxybenzoate polyprenyltransferase
MKRSPGFLIHSNIYLAFGAPAIAYICMVLLQAPFRWEPLAISFCATLFLYNLNRHTDMEEDSVNYPERVKFVKKNGRTVFYLSAVLYILSLWLAFANSTLTLAIALVPLALVFSYSVIRLKKLLIFKNVIVALGWALVTFLVLSYTSLPVTPEVYLAPAALSVFAFIFMRVLIDTIVFDILDVEGDRKGRIKTIANTFGVKKVKLLCHTLNVLSLLAFLLLWDAFLPIDSLTSNMVIVWSFLYIFLITRADVKNISDFVVDGEIVLLGLVVFALQLLA